jgi:conjugal transfer mating pair stabilization protein TraN
VPSQSGYFDDPDRMAREAASQATANTGYRTMRDSMDRRAQFAPQDLDAVVARSNVINDDPLSYTSGMSISGSQGRCVPLPPGTGTAARYMATCNVGYTATQETRTCPVTLNATIEQRQVYGYYCVGGSGVDPASIYNCNRYPAPQCTVTQSYPINLCDPYLGIYWGCNSGDLRVDLVSCTAPVDGATPYSVTGENVVTTSRDESQCAGLAADSMPAGHRDLHRQRSGHPDHRWHRGHPALLGMVAQLYLRPIYASSGLPDAGKHARLLAGARGLPFG